MPAGTVELGLSCVLLASVFMHQGLLWALHYSLGEEQQAHLALQHTHGQWDSDAALNTWDSSAALNWTPCLGVVAVTVIGALAKSRHQLYELVRVGVRG